jgi:peptidoglycan/LPS O-acetylase OafA/YrhL
MERRHTDEENAMTVTTPTIQTATSGTRASSLRRSTVVVGLGAAAVTTAVAAAVHGAGVPLTVDGEMIPFAGFAQMTFLGAVLGGLLLAVLNRRSNVPRRRFLEATAALTALSCVPSVAWPEDAATKIALVAMHLLAAAIIVPVLARHAND